MRRRQPGRHAARRTAMQVLFQWDVTGQEIGSLYEGEVPEYAQELAEQVVARAPELDARITAAAQGWPADRLGAVERTICRIAIVEMDSPDVPVEVAIDEAVELAKRYTTDEAAKLVNGILGKIAREAA